MFLAADILRYPLIVTAIVTALAAIGKAIHWLYGWGKRIDNSLAYIEQEMKLNGGSTMRDAIKRIDDQLKAIGESQPPEGNDAA